MAKLALLPNFVLSVKRHVARIQKCSEMLDEQAVSDFQYISLLQYIDTVNKYRNMTLHLENQNSQ